MQIRKDVLENGCVYHIYSRSIAGYTIFKSSRDFSRMIELLRVYRYIDFYHKYSQFLKLDPFEQASILFNIAKSSDRLVDIIAFCIMPTHIHLALRQVANEGISKFVARVLNSYSRYFNTKHKRLGPLWAGRFKNVLVEDDEQLLHLTRYIHLNPTSAGLVDDINGWKYSSYQEYIKTSNPATNICALDDLFEFSESMYEKFVSDRKNYQRDLSIIKSHIINDYTG